MPIRQLQTCVLRSFRVKVDSQMNEILFCRCRNEWVWNPFICDITVAVTVTVAVTRAM